MDTQFPQTRTNYQFSNLWRTSVIDSGLPMKVEPMKIPPMCKCNHSVTWHNGPNSECDFPKCDCGGYKERWENVVGIRNCLRTSTRGSRKYARISGFQDWKGFHPHLLKKALGKYLKKLGYGQFDIRDQLQHKSVTTTNTYVGVNDPEERTAIARKVGETLRLWLLFENHNQTK